MTWTNPRVTLPFIKIGMRNINLSELQVGDKVNVMLPSVMFSIRLPADLCSLAAVAE
ncbi:MAG: hypothetical protein ACLTZT_14225 [Butyricimonas faecalis]